MSEEIVIDGVYPNLALQKLRDGRHPDVAAQLAGVHRTQLQRWERGVCGIRLDNLLAYAAECGYDVVLRPREAP